jgi:hypothetical protein
MPRLKSPKLIAMPLPFAAAKVYPLSDNCVTQLMVEDRSYPPTGGWLKELSRDHDPALSDVAGSEHSLLWTIAPGDYIRIELRSFGIELTSQASPQIAKELVAFRRWPSSWASHPASIRRVGGPPHSPRKEELDLLHEGHGTPVRDRHLSGR